MNRLAAAHSNKKVLVIGVTPFMGESMEREVEKTAIRFLSRRGFDAVSYPEAFAMYDMALFSQDAVGFILEENNIDYVLTIANVDAILSIPDSHANDEYYPSTFYFDHIRKYRSGLISIDSHEWESILFDVHSFDARSILQTQCTGMKEQIKEIHAVTRQVIDQLAKQTKSGTKTPRGF